MSYSPSERHDRCESAFLGVECDAAMKQGKSQRAFCREHDVARSTLRDRFARNCRIDAPDECVAFFTSPQGEMTLRRIVIAAHFVMTLLGCCGVQLVCTFLWLSGLAAFVGASYGAQQRINVALHDLVMGFGQAEQQRLGAEMPRKKIWLCEDETFFPRMVLVAMDALSGYVLVERFAEKRDEQTWNAAVHQSLGGLAVEVIGVTADQAKAIAAHVTNELGLSVTPDLFHVMHDVSDVTCPALANRVKALENAPSEGLQDSSEQQVLDEARQLQQRMQLALAAMSEATHPVDLHTGELRTGEQIEADLNQMLDEAEMVADDAALSDAAYKGIAKARRAICAMAASVEAFQTRVNLTLEALNLPSPIESAIKHNILPAMYLQVVAKRSRDTEERDTLNDRADRLLSPILDNVNSPLRELSETGQSQLFDLGRDLASQYVRASSCVEGRNGQLSLRHHSVHTLSETKLAALTVVHNFWIERDDMTTAAERFFERKPQDLFDYLIDTMPDLPMPAHKRIHMAPSSLLN